MATTAGGLAGDPAYAGLLTWTPAAAWACGGAALLFAKPPSPVEILNDIHSELVRLYRCVQHHLDELVRQRKSNLFVIANDAAMPGKGIGKLVDAGLVSRMIASHIGLNPKAQQQMMQLAGSTIDGGLYIARSGVDVPAGIKNQLNIG